MRFSVHDTLVNIIPTSFLDNRYTMFKSESIKESRSLKVSCEVCCLTSRCKRGGGSDEANTLSKLAIAIMCLINCLVSEREEWN